MLPGSPVNSISAARSTVSAAHSSVAQGDLVRCTDLGACISFQSLRQCLLTSHQQEPGAPAAYDARRDAACVDADTHPHWVASGVFDGGSHRRHSLSKRECLRGGQSDAEQVDAMEMRTCCVCSS